MESDCAGLDAGEDAGADVDGVPTETDSTPEENGVCNTLLQMSAVRMFLLLICVICEKLFQMG